MKIKALFTPLLIGFLLLISSVGIDARQLFSNNGSSTLSAALTDVGTSMAVVTGDGALFNAPTGGDYELITLTDGTNVEIVKATARSTDTLTIVRAQEGTTAQAWASGTVAQGRLTAATLDQFPQGFDNGGNAKGAGSVNLQSGRTTAANVASGADAVAVGYDSIASAASSVAIGLQASAAGWPGVAIGTTANAAGGHSVAVGGLSAAGNNYDTAIGKSAQIAAGTGGYNTALGAYAAISANVSESVAIGAYSSSAINGTHHITGLSLVHKGNAAANPMIYFSGSEAVFASKVIDFTAAAADDVISLTIPTGATFFPDEIGLIVTAADTVTVQPSVSFGISGNTVALLASTATTKSAVKGRDIFTLLSNDGVNTLTASVKVAATATALSGRFYWKGVLVEDQ